MYKNNLRIVSQSQTIAVCRLKLMFGSLVKKDIRLLDHKDKPATATFGSIARFMEKEQLSKEVFSLAYNHSLASLN